MNRLDRELTNRGLVSSRSQAENYIKLGVVSVNKKVVIKPGFAVTEQDVIQLVSEQYVSRAALKLASIATKFDLNFQDTVVLDVGSSTGGFTDYALQHGAKKVVAVDVGTNQLHPSLRGNPKVELYEKTDIREVQLRSDIAQKLKTKSSGQAKVYISEIPDIVVADVSFISLRLVLPAISQLVTRDSQLIMMCKPQFEAGPNQTNKGVIKNSAVRRQILKDFEIWLMHNGFRILDKADSQVAGTKGNVERFYKLTVNNK
jgi:23S rRNA (cytidine1920-2'-O)/16S rRNA (cytidine1409-2'-O)-methyltransferase